MLFGTPKPAYVTAPVAQPAPSTSGTGCGVLGLWPNGPQYQGATQPPARCARGLFGFLFPPSPVYVAAPVAAPMPPSPPAPPDPGFKVGESRIGVDDRSGGGRHRS